ncbi:MAG: adenylate/guanylate cyclase domain-containing protein, partial [Thermoanaerobaculia bacterium]
FISTPFFLFLFRRRISLRKGIVVSVFVLFFLILTSFMLYKFFGFLFPAISFFVPYLSYGVILAVRSYYKTERKSKYLKETFEQYVAPQIVKEILQNPEKVNLSGERKFVSVLNLDIRGFTSMVANLSAETSVFILNELFSAWVPEIIERDGTLDKFTGDGLMAVFGAPLKIDDCYDRAVEASFSILEKTKGKWQELRKKIKDLPEEIKIGIGISSGEVVAGNIGCKRHKEYTVIGDAANLAARLQELTKEYKKEIIIDSITYDLTKKKEKFSFIGEVNIRGFEKKVAIYSNFN